MRTTTKVAIAGAAVLAVLAGVFIRPYEGSLFIVTKDRWHDVIGMAQARITRATRDCHTVSSLARSSGDWQRIKAHLGKATGGWASPLQVLHEGAWYLVESEFENAEPAIVLIENTQNGLAERASWGGNPGPFLLEPVMWAHLRNAAPQAPNSLIQCFERK